MKFVFILGAGASRQAGGPLMADFLDTARQLYRSDADIDKPAFKRVFDAMLDLHSMYARANVDLDNIEAFFGLLEMGELVCRFADRTPEQIHELRDSLVALIVQTLEQ
ncbi:MAG TPA: hypothetical protein VJU82_06285 [Acidobacteriaceae bacterium]|nr:hypothetical protein [Acidobacteriaceae bacterium]